MAIVFVDSFFIAGQDNAGLIDDFLRNFTENLIDYIFGFFLFQAFSFQTGQFVPDIPNCETTHRYD